ncbi:MAG: hypothetical protein NC938_07440 [Candidatus Omnitrophica bacterium]|nr:hypothetical protein [Candidatus Omnitrophota bacterium]MCM8791499.1 hypothetical protein [Candidatus Omnitrophota bacterium]
MKKSFIILVISFLSVLLSASNARPSDLAQLQQELAALRAQIADLKRSYEARIAQLETRIEDMAKTYTIEAAKPRVAAPAPIQSAGMGRYFQSFNPDVSVIGDFTYHTTDTKEEEFRNQFQMRQTELAFSASVDPYARGDFFFHVEQEGGEWHIGLCEGYLTLLTLPIDGLQAKAGKFKVEFGKANKYHLHNLPWVDFPNMVRNYLGGEGMSEPGVSASYLIPNPWDKYIELTGQVINNRNGMSFAGGEGTSLCYLGHLKIFHDINESSSLELGASLMAGPNDDGLGRFGTNMTTLEGVDLTYKWRPLQQGLYKSVTFQNELLFSQHDRPFLDDGADIIEPKAVNSWGGYSSLEYQFARRWSVFGRYDFSELPLSSSSRENAYSAGITFAQSEYCFWRLQFKHTDRNFDKDSNEIWLQCDFGLGPHRKHEY